MKKEDKTLGVKTIQTKDQLDFIELIDDGSEYSNIISIWDIQDSLLQAYRTIFLTSQSVLFSISVFIATTNKPYYVFFIFPIGVYLLWLMYSLTRKRGYGVWYCQLQILNIENHSYTHRGFFLTEFKKFMQKTDSQKRQILMNDRIGKGLIIDNIRKRMDIQITAIFFVLWFALTIITFLIGY